jgi:hypothetical protein
MKKMFPIVVFTAISLFMLSCEPENLIKNDEVQKNSNFEHIGKILSLTLATEQVQQLYLDEMKENWQTEKSVPLVSFVSDADDFLVYFEAAAQKLKVENATEDLLFFVQEHPDASLSLYLHDLRELEDLELLDSDFKLAVVSNKESDFLNFYKNGNLIDKKGREEEPDFMTLVLQKREGFIALRKENLLDDFTEYNVVPYCEEMANVLPTLNFNRHSEDVSLYIGTKMFINPVHGIYLIKTVDVMNTYNNFCGEKVMVNNRPSNAGGRCERNNADVAGASEKFLRLRLPSGKNTREDFCGGWFTNSCNFQVTVIIPTFFIPTQTSPTMVPVDKYFSLSKSGLDAKSWMYVNLDIAQWQTDIHATQWRYLLIGKNPDAGNTTTIQLDGVSISYTSKDKNLGSALVSYCDSQSANGWQGTTYSTGLAEFSIRKMF